MGKEFTLKGGDVGD